MVRDGLCGVWVELLMTEVNGRGGLKCQRGILQRSQINDMLGKSNTSGICYLQLCFTLMLVETLQQGVILVMSVPPPLWKMVHCCAELRSKAWSGHKLPL